MMDEPEAEVFHTVATETVEFDFDAVYRLLAAIDTDDPRRDEAMHLMAEAFGLNPPHLEKAIAARVAAGRVKEAGQKEFPL